MNQVGTLFQEKGYGYPLTWNSVLFYFLGGLTLFFILLGFYLRYRLWHRGEDEEKRNRWSERWKGLFVYGFGHRRILRSLFPGLSHLLLAWSFLILILSILIILIQEYYSNLYRK